MAVYPSSTVRLRDGAEVTLRSPTRDDAPALIEYLDRVRRETPFLMYSPLDELPTLDAEIEWVGRGVDAPARVKIGAWADGQLVGLCDVDGGQRLVRSQHRAELGISVLAAWCDRGLGTMMMRVLIDWARKHDDIHVLRLGVFANNARAIAVYRKVGFEAEGVRRWSVRFENEQYGDEMVMSMWVGELPAPAASEAD